MKDTREAIELPSMSRPAARRARRQDLAVRPGPGPRRGRAARRSGLLPGAAKRCSLFAPQVLRRSVAPAAGVMKDTELEKL